jgi:hypothetical protein
MVRYGRKMPTPLRMAYTEGPIVCWDYGLLTRADLAGLGSTLCTLSDTRGSADIRPHPWARILHTPPCLRMPPDRQDYTTRYLLEEGAPSGDCWTVIMVRLALLEPDAGHRLLTAHDEGNVDDDVLMRTVLLCVLQEESVTAGLVRNEGTSVVSVCFKDSR